MHIHQSRNQNPANAQLACEAEKVNIIALVIHESHWDGNVALPHSLRIQHTNRNLNETEEEAVNPRAETCNHTFTIRGHSHALTQEWMKS